MRTAIIDWTKRLITEGNKPVLLSGIETLRAIEKADPQLTTRIPSIFNLPDFQNDENWRGVLASFAGATRDVDLSVLKTNASAVFKATRGVMRTMKSLAMEVAMIAVDANEPVVRKEHLRLAFQRVFGPGSSRDNPFE